MCFNASIYLYPSTYIYVHISRHNIYVCVYAHTQKFLFLILQDIHLPLVNTRDCMLIKLFSFLKNGFF